MGQAKAGRYEKDDCQVRVVEKEGSETTLDLTSSVGTLYGPSIKETILATLRDLQVPPLEVTVKDRGAMPWVIQARVETAIRRLYPHNGGQILPDVPREHRLTTRDRVRRSRLYLPGNNPSLMLNAFLFKPDGIILDLEDSVHPSEKDAAMILVRNALCAMERGASEMMVRVNPLPEGLMEIKDLLSFGVDLFLIPKAETPEDVGQIGSFIQQLGPPNPIFLMPIIESAKGLINAFPIAASSPLVAALAFGAEDFTRDIGAARSREGRETFHARCQIVAAARAAGVQPIDTVYSDVEDEEGLTASALEARSLGFEGKGCIHPRQIEVVHKAFNPTKEEVAYALKVVEAMEMAEKEGSGVVSLGSKMIDPPVVARAEKVLDLARRTGLIPKEVSRD